MNKLEITKSVISFVVGAGVTKITTDIITNNINDPEKVAQKVTTIAGATVLGMMAKDASKVYVSAKIDSTIASWKEFKQKLEENKKEVVSEDSDPT